MLMGYLIRPVCTPARTNERASMPARTSEQPSNLRANEQATYELMSERPSKRPSERPSDLLANERANDRVGTILTIFLIHLSLVEIAYPLLPVILILMLDKCEGLLDFERHVHYDQFVLKILL